MQAYLDNVDNIVTEYNKVVFHRNKALKHTNTHGPLDQLIYEGCHFNKKLCIVKAVQFYLGARENLLNTSMKEFVIAYGKPHKRALHDTISR